MTIAAAANQQQHKAFDAISVLEVPYIIFFYSKAE
jgi:hypothetical protein